MGGGGSEYDLTLRRYIDLYSIYTKDEVPRQRDYSLPEYYPNGAVRSKCALRRLPVITKSEENHSSGITTYCRVSR